jgi:hypothetical protein
MVSLIDEGFFYGARGAVGSGFFDVPGIDRPNFFDVALLWVNFF